MSEPIDTLKTLRAAAQNVPHIRTPSQKQLHAYVVALPEKTRLQLCAAARAFRFNDDVLVQRAALQPDDMFIVQLEPAEIDAAMQKLADAGLALDGDW